MNGFYQEVSKVFPDDYLHLGGDEVSYKCWYAAIQLSEDITYCACARLLIIIDMLYLLLVSYNRESNPDIQDWMKKNGYNDYAKLEEYYENKLVIKININ